MPGITGFQVLETLRRVHPLDELSIIMVTARDGSHDVVEAFQKGANDYVTKPIDLTVVMARVNTQLSLRRLSQANREFLGVASHDLKKPLMLVTDAVQNLGEDYPVGSSVTSDLHEVLGIIKRAADFMQHIVQDYLDLCAVDSGHIRIDPRPVSLNALATEICDNNAEYARRKNHQLIRELSLNLPTVRGDSARLLQVIDNLVGNAVKFSPPGSVSQVITRETGEGVIFEVRDNGPGLSEEDLQQIFVGRFVRLANRPTGNEKSTGLGLTICKRLLELHGGEIGVVNNIPGPGATFWFRLPVSARLTLLQE